MDKMFGLKENNSYYNTSNNSTVKTCILFWDDAKGGGMLIGQQIWFRAMHDIIMLIIFILTFFLNGVLFNGLRKTKWKELQTKYMEMDIAFSNMIVALTYVSGGVSLFLPYIVDNINCYIVFVIYIVTAIMTVSFFQFLLSTTIIAIVQIRFVRFPIHARSNPFLPRTNYYIIAWTWMIGATFVAIIVCLFALFADKTRQIDLVMVDNLKSVTWLFRAYSVMYVTVLVFSLTVQIVQASVVISFRCGRTARASGNSASWKYGKLAVTMVLTFVLYVIVIGGRSMLGSYHDYINTLPHEVILWRDAAYALLLILYPLINFQKLPIFEHWKKCHHICHSKEPAMSNVED